MVFTSFIALAALQHMSHNPYWYATTPEDLPHHPEQLSLCSRPVHTTATDQRFGYTDKNKNNQRLAGLQQRAQQPRLAREADNSVLVKLRTNFVLKCEFIFKDPEDVESRSARPLASHTY